MDGNQEIPSRLVAGSSAAAFKYGRHARVAARLSYGQPRREACRQHAHTICVIFILRPETAYVGMITRPCRAYASDAGT